MFFHWLFSLLICAALALYVLAPDFTQSVYSRFEAQLGPIGVRIVGAALLALYLALAVCQVLLIVNRKGRVEKGFITVDSADTGKVRIAVSAIEQMVRQSVRSIDGIHEMKIAIDSADDAIVIGVDASIVSGSHVPTITMNMQRSIRQFVEVNCGVAVRSVSVSINSVASQSEPAHRGFMGLGRAQAAKRSAQEPTPVENTVSDFHKPEAASEGEANQRSDDAFYTGGAPEVPAFDPDRPYESEFAKDLAAMKAKEETEVGDDSFPVGVDLSRDGQR